MFGCDQLGFKPHSITIAKAMTAYVPMAALTVPETMYRAMLDQSPRSAFLVTA
jgi:adenosylmethionine-8-amino-7-oxononanoate aminotransferase